MFADRSESSGMQGPFIYRQLGVSWADYNGDGLMDVFIATTPNNQLFRNNGDHTFTDAAEAAGIQDPSAEAASGAWGDYDADGDLDLFVGNLSRVMSGDGAMGVQNRLYRNDGGTFTDVADTAGVSGIVEGVTRGTTSAGWADFDNDGWIDLLVCNRLSGVYLYRNLGDGLFEHITPATGLSPKGGVEHAAWSDYDLDGDLDVFLSAGEAMMMTPSQMEGGGMDMSATPAQTMEMNPTSNILYRNEGDGTFADVTAEAGLAFETNMARSHTAVWGDYDNDGDPDLFSGNRGSVTMNTLAKSRLYRNNGDGTFTDVTDAAGFNEEYSVFGAAWADVNNDGWLDLYIAIHPDMRDHPDHHINPTRIPHPLYLSNGDGTFTDVNEDILDLPFVSGITDLGHQGGAAFADSDNDGDLDLVVVEAMGLGPMRYYENANAAAGAHWIRIELRSHNHNTYAVGAKIIAETGGLTMTREVGLSSAGWGSQQPFLQTFGLGEASECAVRVVWPDGMEESFGSLPANQRHTLARGAETGVFEWPLYR